MARIVAFGWKYKYLPVQLAPPFLLEAFSIHPSTSTCSLMEAFFNYISSNDFLTKLPTRNLYKSQHLSSSVGSQSWKALQRETPWQLKFWERSLLIWSQRQGISQNAFTSHMTCHNQRGQPLCIFWDLSEKWMSKRLDSFWGSALGQTFSCPKRFRWHLLTCQILKGAQWHTPVLAPWS